MREDIGFFTALGTPTQADGRLHEQSLQTQVRDQLAFGAAGMLVMGSMGLGVFLRQSEYLPAARAVTEAAAGRGRVFIGITDSSVGRCLERAAALSGLAAEGVVATLPYYYGADAAQQARFFTAVADGCALPLYLYDLPAVSKGKISFATALRLAGHSNIRGIKTGDMNLAVDLLDARGAGTLKQDFEVFYSGLDSFDSACKLSVSHNLDGMFSCTGPLAQKMYDALRKDDYAEGRAQLKKIVRLRDAFAQSNELLAMYSHAMNLLGYEGNFAPDYFAPPDEAQKALVSGTMRELGLL